MLEEPTGGLFEGHRGRLAWPCPSVLPGASQDLRFFGVLSGDGAMSRHRVAPQFEGAFTSSSKITVMQD